MASSTARRADASSPKGRIAFSVSSLKTPRKNSSDKDFDYPLPAELIAQAPLAERDQSRLLLVDCRTGALEHRHVMDLPEILRPSDLIVVNNSRVFPARLRGKLASGARIELLLLRPLGDGTWETLGRPGRKLRTGTTIDFGELQVRVVSRGEFGRRTVQLTCAGDLFSTLERIGVTPLPPYIKRGEPSARAQREAKLSRGASVDSLEPTGRRGWGPIAKRDVGPHELIDDRSDRERYQTIYAREPGSVAAPTAGLHFSAALRRRLEARGIEWAEITLHVGYGTFQPIRRENVEEHRLEPEPYRVPGETADAVERARARGGRVVAVGTTTVRTLETAATGGGRVSPGAGMSGLFVYPGFAFRVVDCLLTNFHLPRSSLFLLVSAFGGVELVRRAYAEAVAERYRFYSYGDCMLLQR